MHRLKANGSHFVCLAQAPVVGISQLRKTLPNGCRVIEVNLERCLEDEPLPPPRPLVVDPDHGPTDPRPFTVYGALSLTLTA